MRAERRTRDDAVLTGALLAAASMRAVQSELIPILVPAAGHHAPLCWFSWQQQLFLLKHFYSLTHSYIGQGYKRKREEY